MAETMVDSGANKTIIHERNDDGVAHLSRQGFATTDWNQAMATLREVSASTRDTLLAIAALKDTIRDEGEKTRILTSNIDRERAQRDYIDAKVDACIASVRARIP